ncbi:dihydrolipoyl dehydrogenase [Acetobacterium fimetarium]|uniref:Dihydrolipoyl dehydrogenase n=1 Tax=Acetobacterium fimetarium TaxID=52691 RepID=A0ABR6WYB0_9FIRM|nr:dihydrolipoyl dehydrogenase [Acetobacterium fimetarium]MBC3805545.1 dihydrolipoyl dehydrogenase [Acetobacterium fimetarium]
MKITIIGAGPGGYEAAIMAAKLGAEVTVVEKNEVGGTCLNIGCIPTKALLASADVLTTSLEAEKFGVFNDHTTADLKQIVERKDKVVAGLVKGIEFLFESNRVNLVHGIGKLIDSKTVEVKRNDGGVETLVSDKILLATGSVPVCPEMFHYDGKKVITSTEALALKTPPKSMIIVGGGVIGCELGQFFSRMGTKVTIVEMADQILSTEDESVAKQLLRQFKREKIKVLTSNGVAEVEVQDSGVVVTLTDGKTLEAEMVLLSIGRASFSKGLNLEALGIKVDPQGHIEVDESLETSVKGIYAVGDLINTPFLAHVASKEGIIAAENMLGKNKTGVHKAIPRCVYTDPQVAAVGLTEKDVQKKGIPYKTGSFDFRALGKAKIIDKIQGQVKIIVDEKDVVIGASIVGPEATDLLAELTMAVHLGLTAEVLGDVIHPHPTLSEAIMEALHDVHGKSINKVSLRI